MSSPAGRTATFRFEGHKLSYAEYGDGPRTIVLLHGLLLSKRMHGPLAQDLAERGNHVVTLDLLGHGRSDRPEEMWHYGMQHFARQVVGLMDHLGLDDAVVGGTSLGANVSLEVAVLAPERVQALLLEMPVLDNAVEAGIVAFAPLLFLSRFLPPAVRLTAGAARAVPRSLAGFWGGIVLDTLDQRPASMAAVIHGIFFGRVAPSSRLRKKIEAPALVVGHPRDPIHLAADALMVTEEMPNARHVGASSILEWRFRPERLNQEALDFVTEAWEQGGSAVRRA